MRTSLTLFIGLVLMTSKRAATQSITVVDNPLPSCMKMDYCGAVCIYVDPSEDAETVDCWDPSPPPNNCGWESFAVCEFQANGQCGFTQNDELDKCNADYAASIANWTPYGDNEDDE